MRMRSLQLLAAIAFTLLSGTAGALDAPHDQTFTSGQCDNCHTLFVTTASGKKDASPGCVSCHAGLTNPSLPLNWQASGHQATPGQTGNQHNWSGYAENATFGARSPPVSALSVKLVDGKLQCAVCHDIHSSSPSYSPGSQHTSIPMNVAQPAGGGSLALTAAAAAAGGWRVKVQAGSTFIISRDYALATRTWKNWNGTAWEDGTDPGPGMPLGANRVLDDGATRVTIAGTPAAGTWWDFYVSYPFLRSSNVSDSFCYLCHQSRVMNHVRVSGNDPLYLPNGVRKFSHPVSVALDANGKGYDRAQAAVLEPDGSVQPPPGTPGGDNRPENDLRFDGTLVRCTTCHAAHNAASNSLVNSN